MLALFSGGNCGGGFGGGLFGGGGGSAAGLTSAVNMGQITNDFLYTNLHTDVVGGFNKVDCSIDNLANKLCCIDKDIVVSGCNTNAKIADSDYHTQLGFLGVERGMDFIKYEAAKNTSEILQGQCASTQAILNKMDCIEMQNLRDKLCECKDEMSNWKQSAYLVSQIKPPCPVPAYLTCNPNAAGGFNNFGYGLGFGGYGGYGKGFDGFGGHDNCGCGCC